MLPKFQELKRQRGAQRPVAAPLRGNEIVTSSEPTKPAVASPEEQLTTVAWSEL